MTGVAVIVCGGRTFGPPSLVWQALDAADAVKRIAVVYEGEARGVDQAAREWAVLRGRPVRPFRANWKAHGRAAGVVRNAMMLKALMHDEHDERRVFAFPGGAGTADMVRRALDAGVEVVACRLTWRTVKVDADGARWPDENGIAWVRP